MSDFYGCLSSTSFRVKDKAAFLADSDVQQIAAHAKESGFFEELPRDGGYFAFGWDGQYPDLILSPVPIADDDEEGVAAEEHEIDITDVIQRHILPGDVCQIGVSGNEKLRYIGGVLAWVTSRGSVLFDGTTAWDDRITEEILGKKVKEFQDAAKKLLRKRPGK